jgi:hypothetical protein
MWNYSLTLINKVKYKSNKEVQLTQGVRANKEETCLMDHAGGISLATSDKEILMFRVLNWSMSHKLMNSLEQGEVLISWWKSQW